MKKSSAPIAPSRPALPKIVSIESLRARREGSSSQAALITESSAAESASTDEAMSESERDRLLEELRSELVDLPDVRLDKVIEARSKIARGYYDSDRVRLDILGAMLEEERGPAPASAPRPASPATRKSTDRAPAASKRNESTGLKAKPGKASPASASVGSSTKKRKAAKSRSTGKKGPSKTGR